MGCKVRDEITTRYVKAVQKAADEHRGAFGGTRKADKALAEVIRELKDHDAACKCARFPVTKTRFKSASS
jgi:hypothetical protein